MINAFNEDGERPSTMIGDIELENVVFAYPTRKEVSVSVYRRNYNIYTVYYSNVQVLNNMSVKVPSGMTVAFVGASGCGKSTIVQLVQRFYDPDHGRVRISYIQNKYFLLYDYRSYLMVEISKH